MCIFRPMAGNRQIYSCIGRLANKIVERQDKRIVETQIPKESAFMMRESLVAVDLLIMEYRCSLDGRGEG